MVIDFQKWEHILGVVISGIAIINFLIVVFYWMVKIVVVKVLKNSGGDIIKNKINEANQQQTKEIQNWLKLIVKNQQTIARRKR